jgi:hypothetical protein
MAWRWCSLGDGIFGIEHGVRAPHFLESEEVTRGTEETDFKNGATKATEETEEMLKGRGAGLRPAFVAIRRSS